jgi:LAS superfamily LD-carboxypeptidase LdcB
MKKRKKLTARQMLTLEKHSEHHTKKHMDFMKKEMFNGSTFTAAHKKAQKEVGK